MYTYENVAAILGTCRSLLTFRRVGYDTWSIFKQSLTVLNSEFSFSMTGGHANF